MLACEVGSDLSIVGHQPRGCLGVRKQTACRGDSRAGTCGRSAPLPAVERHGQEDCLARDAQGLEARKRARNRDRVVLRARDQRSGSLRVYRVRVVDLRNPVVDTRRARRVVGRKLIVRWKEDRKTFPQFLPPLIEAMQPVAEMSDGSLVGRGIALDVEMHACHEFLVEPACAFLGELAARLAAAVDALENPFAMQRHRHVERDMALARECRDITRPALPAVVVEPAVGSGGGLEKHDAIELCERHVAPRFGHPPRQITQRAR